MILLKKCFNLSLLISRIITITQVMTDWLIWEKKLLLDQIARKEFKEEVREFSWNAILFKKSRKKSARMLTMFIQKLEITSYKSILLCLLEVSPKLYREREVYYFVHSLGFSWSISRVNPTIERLCIQVCHLCNFGKKTSDYMTYNCRCLEVIKPHHGLALTCTSLPYWLSTRGGPNWGDLHTFYRPQRPHCGFCGYSLKFTPVPEPFQRYGISRWLEIC